LSEAYKKAGVDIAAGNEAVRRIRRHALSTARPEVLGGIGGFGGLFRFPAGKYEDPVLVSGTDGVGTKLKLAFALDRHDTIGIDCVAMCVNDIAVLGAEPLFFLDYLAVGTLVPEKVEAIVAGVAEGCRQAGCALIGGETAEMPGVYGEGEYDIAGFAVGVVERSKLIDGSSVAPGDAVIGLASSGVHSNGYSLVRKLIRDHGLALTDRPAALGGASIGDVLLTPTRIYVKTVLGLASAFRLKGLVHVTGGGFVENIPRVLPEGTAVDIVPGSWPVPPVFDWLEKLGGLTRRDLFTTFNMGIGMVMIVPEEEAEAVIRRAVELGERAYRIGRVTEGSRTVLFGGEPA